uniref:CMP-sialic acid transporter n=1 Tax=Pyramimonas obovata TaxID=1411642 RepID=A0A7S0RXU2_9CHLO|mmetsp:Transcript_8824/g.18305  ORF Transcript_8824/g.18305 Transcript_8824/m.18305 type:complete len:337 (+) Transcript_8824:576-1586(+)|eukprot:CAMPEP_0118926720 /NCGR_PEP_ID=MMETSP1169-20130426/4354_1 /TAXON_ID=36882 /ORGANISM="Pyramimonas obovata, Strain CCMP722" /LENGTH=336 /DNA_ID=CAMNT_0006868331 /DNA_START=570 /DNA_END=1580 /DNA_ORIENTATION=-
MVSSTVKVTAVISQIVLTSSIALLTHATKKDGQYTYSTITVQMFSELIKLAVSAFLLSLQYAFGNEMPRISLEPLRFAKACIPALFYFISNNVNFIIIRELDPVAFQILNNIKILTTAVLFKYMMHVDVSGLQWRMLFVLCAGSVTSQLGSCVDGIGGMKGTTLGYSLKVVNAVLTATATVYNEKFMKGNDDSIHFQNCQLYFFGLLFGMGATVNHFGWEALDVRLLTEGYDTAVVLLVMNYAFVGIATSAVVKYLDNMTKTFAANAAMFVVAIISIVFYNEQPTLQLFVGMFVAAVSVETYNRQQNFGPPPGLMPAQSVEKLSAVGADGKDKVQV